MACERQGLLGAPRERVSARGELRNRGGTGVEWIKSDGRLRQTTSSLEEVMRELGFARRGKKIVDLIRRAIDRARSACWTYGGLPQ